MLWQKQDTSLKNMWNSENTWFHNFKYVHTNTSNDESCFSLNNKKINEMKKHQYKIVTHLTTESEIGNEIIFVVN